jgi:ACS family hexuronate transporter-like MFS transporter
VTPILVPWITVRWGWPTAFVVVGALGLLWLAAWFLMYRLPERHPMVNAEELSLIRSDPPVPTVRLPWLTLFTYRQVWAMALATFLTSPIWWFWLFWIPGYLNQKYGLNILQLGPPLVCIYLMTDVGSIGGGWLSSRLIKRGWTVNAARKTAMVICALCVVPVIFTPMVNLWTAVFLVGLAASAHQGFSANLFTFVSDTMPKTAVSSIVGIGGFAGSVGGMFIAKFAGYVLDRTGGDYKILFGIASSSYLVAILVMHLLVPKIKPYEGGPAGAFPVITKS